MKSVKQTVIAGPRALLTHPCFGVDDMATAGVRGSVDRVISSPVADQVVRAAKLAVMGSVREVPR